LALERFVTDQLADKISEMLSETDVGGSTFTRTYSCWDFRFAVECEKFCGQRHDLTKKERS